MYVISRKCCTVMLVQVSSTVSNVFYIIIKKKSGGGTRFTCIEIRGTLYLRKLIYLALP